MRQVRALFAALGAESTGDLRAVHEDPPDVCVTLADGRRVGVEVTRWVGPPLPNEQRVVQAVLGHVFKAVFPRVLRDHQYVITRLWLHPADRLDSTPTTAAQRHRAADFIADALVQHIQRGGNDCRGGELDLRAEAATTGLIDEVDWLGDQRDAVLAEAAARGRDIVDTSDTGLAAVFRPGWQPGPTASVVCRNDPRTLRNLEQKTQRAPAWRASYDEAWLLVVSNSLEDRTSRVIGASPDEAWMTHARALLAESCFDRAYLFSELEAPWAPRLEPLLMR